MSNEKSIRVFIINKSFHYFFDDKLERTKISIDPNILDSENTPKVDTLEGRSPKVDVASLGTPKVGTPKVDTPKIDVLLEKKYSSLESDPRIFYLIVLAILDWFSNSKREIIIETNELFVVEMINNWMRKWYLEDNFDKRPNSDLLKKIIESGVKFKMKHLYLTISIEELNDYFALTEK